MSEVPLQVSGEGKALEKFAKKEGLGVYPYCRVLRGGCFLVSEVPL